MSGGSDNTHWEQEYRQLLAEIDTRERQWLKLEASLRQAASQLAIAGLGQDAELDTAITTLRAAVDGDVEALDDARVGLENALQLVSRASQTADSDPSHSQEIPDLPAMPLEDLGDIELAVIVDALVMRLREIPELAETIYAKTFRPAPNRNWSTVLNDLANCISSAILSISKQRTELESFLEGVTDQLKDFDKWAVWHLQNTQEQRNSNAELETDFAERIQHLHDDVEASDDIVTLKSNVEGHLSLVADRFRSFLTAESERMDEAEKRNASLASEVQRLRNKTESLTELCGSQEERLMFDTLTRVHSRYAYDQRIAEEFQRWKRNGSPLTFALFDIDKFKSINDNYGHDAGDRLLKRISAIMSEQKRAEDFLARIGGEEFVLLLPGTAADIAEALVNRLREAIAATRFHYRGKPETVTVSCGLAEFESGDSPDSVYKRADTALYKAKNDGRNRCCFAA